MVVYSVGETRLEEVITTTKQKLHAFSLLFSVNRISRASPFGRNRNAFSFIEGPSPQRSRRKPHLCTYMYLYGGVGMTKNKRADEWFCIWTEGTKTRGFTGEESAEVSGTAERMSRASKNHILDCFAKNRRMRKNH